MWALLTEPVIELIKQWSPNGVCDVGAGNGRWVEGLRATGIHAVGYDVRVQGPSVMLGDHLLAAKNHPDLGFLAVWPPDGAVVQEWIRAWQNPVIMLCAHPQRVFLGTVLEGFSLKASIVLDRGIKGFSRFTVHMKDPII